MKTRVATTTVHGHVIVMALVCCLLLGIVLLGVISLSTTDGQMIGRSQSWNGAMGMAEAGIEEAFTHLRYCPTNRASNNWVLNLAGNQYERGRPLGDSRYDVTISTNWDPIIISQGKIRAPGQTNYIVRTVRVMATNDPMFSAALEAMEGIDFSGNNIRINSYDSRDSSYSNLDGSYNPQKFKDRGKVVCRVGPFNIGNANIWGRVETGDDSILTIGPGGVVGSTQFHLINGTGIEQGWRTSTTSGELNPVEVPPGNFSPPPRSGNNYSITNGTYSVGSLIGTVHVYGQATLIVNSDFKVSNLTVESGASLKLYVNAPDVTLSKVENLNIRAESFMYYGLPNNTDIALGGNGQFTGVIYAPNANLKISGGGADVLDYLGAIIARTVTVTGHMNFHWDEATMKLGSRGFIASRWDELSSL